MEKNETFFGAPPPLKYCVVSRGRPQGGRGKENFGFENFRPDCLKTGPFPLYLTKREGQNVENFEKSALVKGKDKETKKEDKNFGKLHHTLVRLGQYQLGNRKPWTLA